jgi:hypothetical protein
MNAKVDPLSYAFDKAFEAVTKPRRHISAGEARFESMSPAEQRRCVGHWLAQQQDQDGWIMDQLMELKPNELLANFEAGDDAANGLLVARALLGLKRQIGEDEAYWESK